MGLRCKVNITNSQYIHVLTLTITRLDSIQFHNHIYSEFHNLFHNSYMTVSGFSMTISGPRFYIHSVLWKLAEIENFPNQCLISKRWWERAELRNSGAISILYFIAILINIIEHEKLMFK